MRVRIPRPGDLGEAPCAVLINTSGGIAEGDRIEQAISWGKDTTASVASQAAEKVYRAVHTGSTISTVLDLASGAHGEWLPQETILFNQARLTRDTRIMMAGDATFLGIEAIVLGRHAMGETMKQGFLRDSMRIWRDGRLVYADTLLLDGKVESLMAQSATGGGAGAVAVLVHASDRAEHLRDPVRAALKSARGHAAASAWNGLLAIRMLAPDGETLRHDIALALAVLRDGRPLPRVWSC
jgi:urease accessory protein